MKLVDTKKDGKLTEPLSRRAVELFNAAMANQDKPGVSHLVIFDEPGNGAKRRPYALTKIRGLLVRALVIRFHGLGYEAVSRVIEGSLSAHDVSE